MAERIRRYARIELTLPARYLFVDGHAGPRQRLLPHLGLPRRDYDAP
jgi:hypothetical protein